MKLTRDAWFEAGRRMGLELRHGLAMVLGFCVMAVSSGGVCSAQAVSTTTVQGTVYLANGQAGAGTVSVSWPAFTTATGQSITAGHMMVTISPDGFLSVNLAPNVGATPAGLYYTAVYQMSDGTTSTQYWVVPTAAEASLGSVQAQVMPAAQAVQAVSKSYVDQSIAEASLNQLTALGGTLSGALNLDGDPTQPMQAADKHYVDSTFAQAVPLAGGNMTGALVTPAVNGLQSPAAGSPQATIQAAVSAAGTSGAVEIPATYAGTDSFTNPNGVYVRDLRQKSSQQFERSVKEFGAVCDGVTDDTNALQSAINYAQTHGVSLTIPQGTCKTRTLVWHGESIGGFGKQVSALMGFPGMDVLASAPDSVNLLSYTRLHDMTIYVDQSVDASCSAAVGRMPGGSCTMSRPMENNSIFSPGGNGLSGTAGTGAAWAVGNCAIAMPALTGAGGNGLQVAELENLEIVATGVDPMAAQYPGAHSTHTCGLYLAQWPQWSEFRNIDINGLNTGIAIPALPGTTPAGLMSDSNRWEDITIHGTHGFTAATGSHNVLDNVVVMAGNSAATGEPPTGLVLDFAGTQQGWIVRTPMVNPSWTSVQPQLIVTAAGGAVSGVTVGAEHGLGFDPYGAQVPLAFSGGCSAQATATVNSNGSIGSVAVTQGGVGCSGATTASVNVTGSWDTAAPVNLISGQDMSLFGGNLLHGTGGYTVWNAAGSQSYGTQLAGGGGTLPGGGSYQALVANSGLGSTYPVDQFAGVDFGAKLQACVGTVNASYGGTCDARNFSGTLAMGSNVRISTANATVLLPCATISTANQVIVTAGTRNVTLHGCASRGASTASGSQGGTVFLYSGAGAMVQVGDPTYAMDTNGFHMDNAVINTTGATSATAQGLVAYRTQELNVESLYFLGNQNQTGMTLDGTGNYTGGSFSGDQFDGFQTAVNAIGHQITSAATTDWMNASTFVRLHIDCPTSGGSPIGGTFGINLQQGDGNTFTGGDVEGCSTALHLGANAQNNTIVGLRNENSSNQVVADVGSSYNNWMTGGTMFTGQLTDNGTRNSFLDTFHRSFNGLNGDWYGSQKDATVTNHIRLGTGLGNERGLLNEIQTDYGYRWTEGYTDATAGEQFYQVQDLLNNVNRFSIGQYNNGQSSTNNQTVLNAAGTGAVVLNGSNNSGTGGVVIGSGGPSETTVATIDKAGNAQFTGTLQVSGVSTFVNTPTVKNQVDAEIDAVLWAGLTQSQKESLIYKDWNGNSQWYMEKDASNNWELNSATGGLDSFKAYQSSNSGDTYINASNGSGAVRVNYETGAGTAFKVYGGSSGSLYASFTAPNAIEFPGLAATSGASCLQVDNSGYISNIGAPCGTGNGSGVVSSANAGQIAYYTANGASVGGVSAVPITAGGTGAANLAAALQNLGAFAYPGATGIPFGLTSSTSRQATTGDLTALLGYSPLKPANNLNDVASPTAALATLGGVPLAGGTMTGALTATQFNGPLTGAVTGNVTGNVMGTSANVTGTVLLANGGTGAMTAVGALANLGGQAALGFTPLKPTNNLNDVASPTAALTTLGGVPLAGGTMTGALTATHFNGPLTGAVTGNVTGNVSGTSANVTGTVLLANGGTGAATAAAALATLGGVPLAGGTMTGALTATQFNGPLTGAVTGNVTGNVTGTSANVTGTVLLANGGTGAATAVGALANLGGQAALGYAPLKPANNLSDVASPTAALTTLGGVPLAGGTMTGALTATQFNGPLAGAVTGNVTGNVSGTSANVTGTVLLANGGTGAATAAGALANLGGQAALGFAPLNATSNLTDVASPATALTNLGGVSLSGGTMTGALAAPRLNGPLTGNVTGNVSGTASNVTGTVLPANGGTGATSAAGALANLGAQPALGYTPLNSASNLTDVASPATALANLGGQAALGFTPLQPSNNLSDVASPAAALAMLGGVPLAGGTMTGALTATQFNGPLAGAVTGNVTGNVSGTSANVTGTVLLANGGTGAGTAAAALANLGGQAALGFTPLKPANNLSDVNSPATAMANLGGVSITGATFTGPVGAPAVVSGILNTTHCNPLTQSGADIGAQVNACIALLNASYSGYGVVDIPAGLYSYTTSIQRTACCVSIEGAGKGVTLLTYNGNADGMRFAHLGDSGFVDDGGHVGGFTLNAGSGTPTALLHSGDIKASTFHEMELNGSVATSPYGDTTPACLWLDNTYAFTERNTFLNLTIANCVHDILLTNTAQSLASESWEYNSWTGVYLYVSNGGEGLSVMSGSTYPATLDHNFFEGSISDSSTGTLIHFYPNTRSEDTFWAVTGEQNTGTSAVTQLELDSGVDFEPDGYIHVDGKITNNLAVGLNVNAPHINTGASDASGPSNLMIPIYQSATSSQNWNSGCLTVRPAYWTGSISATTNPCWQVKAGTGINPTLRSTFYTPNLGNGSGTLFDSSELDWTPTHNGTMYRIYGLMGNGNWLPQTTSTAKVSGDLASWDSNGNVVDPGYSLNTLPAITMAPYSTSGAASSNLLTFCGYNGTINQCGTVGADSLGNIDVRPLNSSTGYLAVNGNIANWNGTVIPYTATGYYFSGKVVLANGTPAAGSYVDGASGAWTPLPAIPAAASATPAMNGVAVVGIGTTWARADHVHPSDTTRVPTTTTVNGHALSANVVVSASDLTTGTLPHAQLPALVSADVPNNSANTAGTAAIATRATEQNLGQGQCYGTPTASSTIYIIGNSSSSNCTAISSSGAGLEEGFNYVVTEINTESAVTPTGNETVQLVINGTVSGAATCSSWSGKNCRVTGLSIAGSYNDVIMVTFTSPGTSTASYLKVFVGGYYN